MVINAEFVQYLQICGPHDVRVFTQGTETCFEIAASNYGRVPMKEVDRSQLREITQALFDIHTVEEAKRFFERFGPLRLDMRDSGGNGEPPAS